MLALAILSIANLVLEAVLPWKSQSSWLVVYIDVILTAFFLADFVLRVVTTPSTRTYLWRGGGILDLLSCSPGLRILRLSRIIRAVRIASYGRDSPRELSISSSRPVAGRTRARA
jgi:hypothetical protein